MFGLLILITDTLQVPISLAVRGVVCGGPGVGGWVRIPLGAKFFFFSLLQAIALQTHK